MINTDWVIDGWWEEVKWIIEESIRPTYVAHMELWTKITDATIPTILTLLDETILVEMS